MRKFGSESGIFLIIGTLMCVLLNYIELNVYIIGLVNIISLLFFSYSIYKIQGKFLTPILLVSICLYIFHSGHLWLALLQLSPYEFLTSFDFDYQTINYTYILNVYKDITIVLIIFMSVATTLVKPITYDSVLSDRKRFCITRLLKYTFYVLYVFAMYFELKRAIAVSATSYGEGYLYGSRTEQYIASFVNVLLLLFMYVYRHDKKRFRLYLGLQLFRTLFIMFFVGNRGTSVIYLLITLFIVVNYSYLALNKRKIKTIMLISLVFVLVALPFISATRGGSRDDMSISEFMNKNNPIENFLIEFGGTASNVFLTKDYVYSKGASYGIQFVGTTLSILPGSTKIFGNIISNNVSIGMKLNNFAGRKGLGGSLISQLYFNFYGTWFLYVSVILTSILMVWTSNQLMKKQDSLYYILFLLCLLSGLFTWVRGEWYDVIIQVKFCIYVLVMLKIFKNKLIIRYA